MTEVFFNCSSPGHILRDRRGLAVSDLSEAYAQAEGFVRSLLMTPTAEDWRGWELRVTDELGCEIFAIPFASVLGKAHWGCDAAPPPHQRNHRGLPRPDPHHVRSLPARAALHARARPEVARQAYARLAVALRSSTLRTIAFEM